MVYVGPLFYAGNKWYRAGNVACYLFTDGETTELHSMAEAIGMNRARFQIHRSGLRHYELPPEKKELAIKLGAKKLDEKEMILLWRKMKAAQERNNEQFKP